MFQLKDMRSILIFLSLVLLIAFIIITLRLNVIQLLCSRPQCGPAERSSDSHPETHVSSNADDRQSTGKQTKDYRWDAPQGSALSRRSSNWKDDKPDVTSNNFSSRENNENARFAYGKNLLIQKKNKNYSEDTRPTATKHNLFLDCPNDNMRSANSSKEPLLPGYGETQESQEKFFLPIFGDGNCFYRSISRFIYKTQSFHHKVRQDLADYYCGLQDDNKSKIYSIKNLCHESHRKKILGCLLDDGWGGIDECPLVAATYERIVVVRNIILRAKYFAFNIFLPDLTEWVLYFPISEPSFKEICDSFEKNTSVPLGPKEKIIFISFNSSRNGEVLAGCHFETFWPV